jgi:hypothetical protein
MVAVLLQPLAAFAAAQAGIDQAADADQIAGLVAADLGPDGRDPADDLMARHERPVHIAPLALGCVQIGVADAAEQDLDLHIIGAQIAAIEIPVAQRGAGVERSVGGGGDHRRTLGQVMADKGKGRTPQRPPLHVCPKAPRARRDHGV